MRRKSLDLILVAAATCASAASALLPLEAAPARLLLGLPLAFILPGYALMAAILPEKKLGAPERLLFGLGLSLVAAILVGLGLNVTPWGLALGAWPFVLGGLTLGACAVAWARRANRPAYEPLARQGAGPTPGQGFLFGLAAIIVVAALTIASAGATQKRAAGFTQLWMLPAKAGNATTARLGVGSGEYAQVKYRLELKVDGRLVRQWMPIELQPGEKWETTVVLPPAQESVEALLYRLDTPGVVYSRVALWPGP